MLALRRLLWLLAFLLLPILTAGCFEVGEAAVRNDTDEPVFVWTSQIPCDNFDWRDLPEQFAPTRLLPGEEEVVTVFKSDLLDVDFCFAVAMDDYFSTGIVLTHVLDRATLYSINEQPPLLRVLAVGPYEEEITFDFSPSPLTLAILGVPFGLGAAAALFISAKYFFDYYVRKRR